MRPSLLVYLVGFCAALLWFEASASAEMSTLKNNPFSRPETLKPKPLPPPPAPTAVVVPEEIELQLTATMVSRHAPMAIVDGELLGIGDSVRGMRLIAVMEGKAIFTRDGRRFTFEIDNGRRLADMQ